MFSCRSVLGTACNVSRAGFLLLVLVEEDHLAVQSFSEHFSHFTSDSFGLKATLYAIIGEFLPKRFRHLPCRSLKDQSGFSDIQIINVATPATSNILKKRTIGHQLFFLLQEKIVVRWSMLSTGHIFTGYTIQSKSVFPRNSSNSQEYFFCYRYSFSIALGPFIFSRNIYIFYHINVDLPYH